MIQLAHHDLKDMMRLPLPTRYQQKRLAFRPTEFDIMHTYMQLNHRIFDNELNMPYFLIKPRCRKYWGMCVGEYQQFDTGSYCEIQLMDKWFCAQWAVTTLAHEMVHQYQWDVDRIERKNIGKDGLMSHGPSFFKFRDRLSKYNISLKSAHSMRRWFKHQDLFKC